MNRARLVLGLLAVGLPPDFGPAWTIAVASFGALAVVAAAAGPSSRQHAAVSVAVGAAIVTCAFSHAGIPALAAEGVLILAYVLAGEFPRRQLIAGVVATLVVAGALTVHPGASAWLTGAGLVAAVAAFAVAVPSRRR